MKYKKLIIVDLEKQQALPLGQVRPQFRIYPNFFPAFRIFFLSYQN